MNAKQNRALNQCVKSLRAMMNAAAELLMDLLPALSPEKNFAYIRNDEVRKLRSRLK